MLKGIRISLANKCQLLFGLAVLLVMTAALTVVALRMQALVERGPERRAQDLAEMWLGGQINFGDPIRLVDDPVPPPADTRVVLSLVHEDEFLAQAKENTFLAQAIERFESVATENERFDSARDTGGRTYFRYARAVRASDLARLQSAFHGGLTPAGVADPLRRVLFIQLRDHEAARQQTVNRVTLVAAGLFSGLLAIAVFYYITTRIILSPVRVLRGYAERVSQGDLSIRSDINTGDEFEQLSDMFNTMLSGLKAQQDELASANQTLDLKLMDLAESNVALYEANELKGDFLSNVSHELRTPLNSIIGFAEVLQDTLADQVGPVDEKRKRYTANIIVSSRRLLELVNDLLDLAKIEAGKVELRIDRVSVADTVEGLITLIRPQAEKKDIDLRVLLGPRLPLIETDPGKLQQVVFNFLANAVKFTPPRGRVTLRAELAPAQTPLGEEGHDPRTHVPRLRIAVTDTGPGIDAEDQARIFDKFTQLDRGVTKAHGGTGLGLTIARDLAQMLGGSIEVDSIPGRGATFSVLLPVSHPPAPQVKTLEADPAQPAHADSPADNPPNASADSPADDPADNPAAPPTTTA